jgi:heptaprenyl diphosphate synthase
MSRRVIPGLESPDPVLEAEIRRRLEDVEASLEKAVHAESELLAETASYLLAAGGKRFRPMLVLLAGYFGDPTDPRLVPGAVAIELVHAATLYHDDVIDEAESRHGVASVNARWDNTVAILTGDYLFARASEISTELGTDVCALLARTIATLCDGQIREVEASGRVTQTQASYLEIIRRKTGVLIATACRLGGMLSDAPPWSLDVLEEFGEALGLAFQLSDDIMDVVASEDELGKEPGVDLREGVYTLPVLHALHEGERSDELRTLLSGGVPEGERLERALEIARSPETLVHARAAVSSEVARARGLAARLPDVSARRALLTLAEFLAVRCGAETGRATVEEVDPAAPGRTARGAGRDGPG